MKYKVLLALFFIALVASSILAFEEASKVCEENGGECSVITKSDYTKLGGINNTYLGIVVFLFLVVFTFSEIKRPKKIKRFIINLGVIIGSILALYFIYLQLFVLKLFCKYCMLVDFSMLLALVVLILSWKRQRKWKKYSFK